jgi:Heparinase II/III-like protein
MIQRLTLLLCTILSITLTARADHPELLTTNAQRDAIQSKIENSPWAKQAFAALKARVDPYVDRCQSDPQFISSRLFMNWQTHYTLPIVASSRWVGGEGSAPIPTPRFGGARDWATKYKAPDKLEDLKPFNDDHGKVWLFNSETKTSEWADPGLTGRMFETVNERILQTAADAGFIYWLNGDEKYAKYAGEILCTYMNGFSYVQPPRLPPGDRSMAGIIGVTSFEVIHEDVVTPISVSYDFLYDYLKSHGKDVTIIQTGLKRFANRVIAGGSAEGNWNLNQARIIAYSCLPLEDNAAYPDNHGRAYYDDVVLNAQLPNQRGINEVVTRGYDMQTAVWPEAPGYGFGTAKDLVLIATLADNDKSGKSLLSNPLLSRAILAQAQLCYPNGWSIGLGDTDNTRINTTAIELLIAAARNRGDADLESQLTAILDREIDSGNYDRSAQSNLVALTQYVGDLKPVSAKAVGPSRTFWGKPLNVFMQRNPGDDVNHSLAAAMYGTDGGHIHANGLTMELYGAGLVLGADPGRGSSYWQPDHADYYSQPPAHNTVIVNAHSTYPIGRQHNPMQLDFTEPADRAQPLSPNISVAQASFHYTDPAADQQRTLALIRIGPRSGFYFDVFRSRAAAGDKSFHDYLYHNVGQSLAISDANQKPLLLEPTQLLNSSNGCLKGYDYFKNEKSTDYDGDIHATFSVDLPDAKRSMSLWMPGQPNRKIFSLQAPPDHAAREACPALSTIPMPTLLVRQSGDAWAKPFIAVYEPYLDSDGPTIQSVHSVKLDDDSAATIVQGKEFTAYLVQSNDSDKPHTIDHHTFKGRFSALILHNNGATETYPTEKP